MLFWGLFVFSEQWIREKVESGQYRLSLHADRERLNDALTLSQLLESLAGGRILEQYPDTGRGPSCLVAGFSDDGTPIHLVCAGMGDNLLIVTAYIPTPPKFKSPFERG